MLYHCRLPVDSVAHRHCYSEVSLCFVAVGRGNIVRIEVLVGDAAIPCNISVPSLCESTVAAIIIVGAAVEINSVSEKLIVMCLYNCSIDGTEGSLPFGHLLSG